MPVETPLQRDMFSGDLVDTRTPRQKRQAAARDTGRQLEMFAPREVLQFGVKANPKLPLSPKTKLELSVEDRRTDVEKEQDGLRAAEAITYSLFMHDPSSFPEPRNIERFPSNLSFDLVSVEEPEPQLALQLTDELDILLESTRDGAYARARDTSHLAGHDIYPVGDHQLELWKADRSGYFLVTYSEMERVENIEWVAQPEMLDDHADTSEHAEPPMEAEPAQVVAKKRMVSVTGTPSSGEKVTPLYTQYDQIKQQFPQAIVLFRLGDFYETFGGDAETAARELDLVLTSRAVSKTRRIPMAGVPHHAVESYIARLVAMGYHVAVCEQVSHEPVGGVIPRDVTRVVTPGGFSAHNEPSESLPSSRNQPTWDNLRRQARSKR